MAKSIVIADASPLIAFGRTALISLLSDTLGSIIIPESVANECLTDPNRPGATAIQQAIQKEIITTYPDPDMQEHQTLHDILGKGEATAIALALKLKKGLLIDDKLGRNAAKKLNLKVIGTAGVLLLAKQKNLIKNIGPLILELKQAGYYLSPSLITTIMTQAKETL